MTTNILLAGVGGQGTILAARIIAQVAEDAGHDVKVSEIHGMSQRGGSVMTQVRFGEDVAAPIISPGTADIIIAFEQIEALRILPYLRKGGTIIINEQKLPQLTVLTGEVEYPEDVKEKIAAADVKAIYLDAFTLAVEAGSSKATNLVLMGQLSQVLDFPEDFWMQAINSTVKEKFVELNIKAFNLGRHNNQ